MLLRLFLSLSFAGSSLFLYSCSDENHYYEDFICEHDGQVQETASGKVCVCPQFYTGKHCETTVLSCQDNPCKQGTCEETAGSTVGYTCRCQAGYEGVHCDINTNDCPATNTCQNGGTCKDGVNAYTCECPHGFTGTRCEQTVSRCSAELCGHGTCQETTSSYQCSCYAGYEGTHCQNDINECQTLSQNCNGHGTCQDLVNAYACTCDLGYTGRQCETTLQVSYTLVENLLTLPSTSISIDITDVLLSQSSVFNNTQSRIYPSSYVFNKNIALQGKTLTLRSYGDTGYNLEFSGAITGNGTLQIESDVCQTPPCTPRPVVLSGSNSNTGTYKTFLRGPVVVSKRNGALAFPNDVELLNQPSSKIQWTANEQIHNTASITVRTSSGVLDLNGYTETIDALYLANNASLVLPQNSKITVNKLQYNGVNCATGSTYTATANFCSSNLRLNITGTGSVKVN
jgi:hypothetical protein